MPLATLEIELDGFDLAIAGLEAAPGELSIALRDALNESVDVVWRSARDKVPVDTGLLKSAIGAKHLSGLGVELIGSVGVAVRPPPYGDALEVAVYARAIEQGRAATEIRARGRKNGGKNALWWEGARHPVRRLHHPEWKAQPYLKPALLDNERHIVDLFRDAVQRVLARIPRGGA
jgi:hypothetical protein